MAAAAPGLSAAVLIEGTAEWLADAYDAKTLQEYRVEEGPCGGVACLDHGRLAWTVLEPGRVQVLDVEAKHVEWSQAVDKPHCIAFVPGDPPRLWVSSPEKNRIYWLDRTSGEHQGGIPFVDQESGEVTPAEAEGSPMARPQGLAFWQDAEQLDPDSEARSGAVWVADSGNDRVLGFDPHSGAVVGTLGKGLVKCPTDVAALDLERLAVVSRTGGHVFGRDGSLLFRFNCHMMIGNAVTFDCRPTLGVLAVSDEYTDRICLFCGSTGKFLRGIPCKGLFSECTGAHKSLAFHIGSDGYGCKLFMADFLSRRISKFNVGLQEKPVQSRRLMTPEERAASRGSSRPASRKKVRNKDKIRLATN